MSKKVSWVTSIAVIVPLVYGSSRVLWAAGIPIGIDQSLLDELHVPGWGSLYVLALCALSETTALFTHVFLKTRAERVPGWVPGLGGRRASTRLVLGGLAAPLLVLWLMMLDSFTIITHGLTQAQEGLPAWSSWAQIATFWAWGISLTLATIAYTARDQSR